MSKKELNIFKLLSEKPWEESQKAIDDKHDGKTLTLSREKLVVTLKQSFSSDYRPKLFFSTYPHIFYYPNSYQDEIFLQVF